MNLQDLLDNKHIAKYRLSKISGGTNTRVMDICSGKIDIGQCSARTIQQFAKALDCSVEYVIELESPTAIKSKYDIEASLLVDKEYI